MTDKNDDLLTEAPIKVKGAEKISNTQKPSSSPPQQLDELKMSWAGKLFFAGIAGWLGGTAYKGVKKGMSAPKLPIKIRGTKQQIKAVMDAITSSKEFQREINKPGATIDGVIKKLKLKNLNQKQFEKLTGKKWPL